MGSLPPPTITPFSSTFPSQRDHLKPPNFPINGKSKGILLRRVSGIHDSNRDQNTTSLIIDAQIRATSPRNPDRRSLLLGLMGSLCGTAAMNIGSDNPLAMAASIVTPDTSKPIVANGADMPLITTISSTDFPIILDKVVRVRVKRSPERSRSKKEKEGAEEVLVVDGIEFDRNEYVKFDALVNEEDEGACRPDNAEFAGSFSNVPHKGKKKMRTCLRLGIGELLEDLEAEGDESLLVTLVPRAGIGLLSIGGVKIELE